MQRELTRGEGKRETLGEVKYSLCYSGNGLDRVFIFAPTIHHERNITPWATFNESISMGYR